MARGETYPWSTMLAVGDYFVVPYEFKPYSYVSMMVSQKNYRKEGQRYSATKTADGTIVVLVEIVGETPPHEFVTDDGILCGSQRHGAVLGREKPLGKKLHPVELSQSQKVDRMSVEQRAENLPWWTDAHTGKPVMNPKVMAPEDVDRYVVGREPIPGPDVPYPEYYNLGDDMIRRPPEAEEEGEEDWGDHPVLAFAEEDSAEEEESEK